MNWQTDERWEVWQWGGRSCLRPGGVTDWKCLRNVLEVTLAGFGEWPKPGCRASLTWRGRVPLPEADWSSRAGTMSSPCWPTLQGECLAQRESSVNICEWIYTWNGEYRKKFSEEETHSKFDFRTYWVWESSGTFTWQLEIEVRATWQDLVSN